MNVQLLLLLAFCAFTHVGPTVIPTAHGVLTTHSLADLRTHEATGAGTELDVITGPTSIHPMTAEQQDAVGFTTEAPSPQATSGTEEPTVESETPTSVATEAAEPLTTESPAVEITPTKAPEEAEIIPQWTETVKVDMPDEVVVEDGTEEGLSSGQVVGIVIGALLAVVIVIIAVIAVVRRMGKYSP